MAESATLAPALDPNTGQLIERSRARLRKRLGSRQLWTTLGSSLAFLAVSLALPLLIASGRSFDAAVAATLLVAYALASRVEFEVGVGFAVPTQLVFVPMLFLVPLPWVPLLVVAGNMLGQAPDQFRGRVHPARLALAFPNAWHALGPVAVLAAAGEPAADWRASWHILVLALGAQLLVDAAVALLHATAVGASPRATLPLLAWAYPVDVALAPLGLLVAYVGPDRPYAILLALPLVGLLAFFARERRARVDHALELGHAYRGTAFLLGDVVEADDAYTGSHSRDVVSLVLGVADELRLDAREHQLAEMTALLHDVGKIRVPDEIINKPGPLDADERAIIEQHTIEGEQLLARVGGLLGAVGRIVRSCHEWWDGSGYPDGLAGEQIPLVARIVCCCDAFSAMTTDRPYRHARSTAEALEELERCAGTQFDPAVVAAVKAVVARGGDRADTAR